VAGISANDPRPHWSFSMPHCKTQWHLSFLGEGLRALLSASAGFQAIVPVESSNKVNVRCRPQPHHRRQSQTSHLRLSTYVLIPQAQRY